MINKNKAHYFIKSKNSGIPEPKKANYTILVVKGIYSLSTYLMQQLQSSA